MADDPSRTIALAMAEDICPGCACCDKKGGFFRNNRNPCPFFHPDNFYYDKGLERFWCQNWVDENGNEKPPEAPQSRILPARKA